MERAVAACEQSDAELCEIVGFDELPRERQAAIIRERHARAAIASLREPDEEMRAAMWHATADDWSGDADAMLTTAWTAGIDAALSEPGSGEGGE